MEYREVRPCKELVPFIHSYWELKGENHDNQWERNFPDGCAGLVMNLADTCLTDNGSVALEFGKTYVAGAMTSFKDSFIDSTTHLIGVCFRPAKFANFYKYMAQIEITGTTVELERVNALDIDSILADQFNYLNHFFTRRILYKNCPLQSVINDIHSSNGLLDIHELAKRNGISIRQLERKFAMYIGISPKEYSNIIRFQMALSLIKNSGKNRSLLDIAFECGFYDHSHLTNEIKRKTGLLPSQL